ncbi:MAG: TIGR04053 family radical SAM/SPASM domain-containing protein [Nitrososphaerota archaeon]
MKVEDWINRFHEAPLLVFWESTKACPLACKHCRADAILKPLPGELTTGEGRLLIEQVASFGDPKPLLVITGGDALMRSDLFELIDYTRSCGVPVAVSPSVSSNLSDDILRRFKEASVKSLSISLDGATAATHEDMRQVPGNFNATLDAIARAVKIGLALQVNTVVWKKNIRELPVIAKLIMDLGVRIWEVFFLIVTGRAVRELDITSQQYEDVVQFLFDVSRYGLQVRTVEAPFYRRAKMERVNGIKYDGVLYNELVDRLRTLMGEPKREPDRTIIPTRDGFGIIFVAYDGTIFPSGFLPYPLSNIRLKSLVEVYKTHPILVKMRHGLFRGRCGICEYKSICGGSRARAYAEYGDPLATDPACIYEPKYPVGQRVEG